MAPTLAATMTLFKFESALIHCCCFRADERFKQGGSLGHTVDINRHPSQMLTPLYLADLMVTWNFRVNRYFLHSYLRHLPSAMFLAATTWPRFSSALSTPFAQIDTRARVLPSASTTRAPMCFCPGDRPENAGFQFPPAAQIPPPPNTDFRILLRWRRCLRLRRP